MTKQIKKQLIEDDLDGLLQLKKKEFDLTLQNSNPSTAKALLMKVNQAVASQAQSQLIKQNTRTG